MTLIFEHLFNHIILQRGYDYYIYKKVKEIAIENDKITAKVMGSDEYSVEVVIENKQIKEMHCDCPYFDGGNNCKHIAAVLYMVRSTESTQIEKVEDDSIINLLDSLSHEELYRFLKEELQTNHDLKFKFKSKYDKSKDNKTVSWHLNHIDSIIDNHLGYDNFINYNDASDFEMDMDRVIEGISDLVENEQYHVAFEMIRHTINSLNNLDIDDSLGTTANIMRELVEILCGIIDETSGEIYEQIFQWLLEIVSGSTLDWMEDELIEVLMEYYNEEDKIAKKIKTVNRIISSMKVTESWSSKYELSKWVANKYILLNEAGNHDEEINQLFHDYAYLSSIRDILIENRLKNKEYQEAIDLLMEGKDIYSGSAGIVNDYSDKLIDIYRITNREKELFEESEKRLFEYSLNSMEAYLGYKKLYDENQWEREKENILAKLKNTRCDIKIFYAEEKMLDNLIEEIKKSPDQSGIDMYKDMLFDDYPAETLELLIKRVERMAQHTKGRKYYKSIVYELRSILKYPNGEKMVMELISEWRIKYSKRRAMMEELDYIHINHG